MDSQELQALKYKKMTEEPVEKLVVQMAIPTIISMLITSFYNMADTFFVSKINSSATAAVGIIFSVMAMIQAIGFCFGHGSGNYISRQLGQKNIEEAKEMASTGFFSAFIIGILMTVIGSIFLTPLAKMLGATDSILPYAKEYMQIILIGAPFMISTFVLNNQLRLQGNASYAMIGISIGAILNVILDPIFIFILNMGIKGAALATLISQIVSFILMLKLSHYGGTIAIKLKYFRPSISKYIEIIKGGFPSLCRQGIASFATVFLNIGISPYGDSAIAAMSVVMRVTNFASSALIGFGQGFQPVCGFNYGAKHYERVKDAFWFCVKVSTVVLIMISIAGIIFAPNIISLFSKNDSYLIEIGATAL
ncbi:MAG: MATE family efflux transporter, partial [Peptostreptococcaceae bacterium]